MRKAAQGLLLLFVFTIPWEYSLDLGAPWGNIARLTGLVVLLATGLSVIRAGHMRKPGLLQWLALVLYLWFCCSCFWSAAPEISALKLRAYFQEMMLVWLVWELMETPDDLRNLARAWLAGSWVLAILTGIAFLLRDPEAEEQIRFVATGQDPNDVARFLALGIPVAALFLDRRERWMGRLIAAGYIPLSFACVLLTASRSGFLLALVALAGCGVILFRRNPRGLLAGALILLVIVAAVRLVAPHETFLRLGSTLDQLQNADLNQRVSIWSAGWQAFLTAPICGHGAGTFVTAARLAPEDTAHNTILSILVEGGLVALALAGTIVACSLRAAVATGGALRKTLFTLMIVWLLASLAGTVAENRMTWLLLGMVALSARLADESRDLDQASFDPSIPDAIDVTVDLA